MRISSNIQSVPSNCTWDGWHTIYLAKSRVRKFSSRLIAEERDANGNVTTFVHTSFLDGVGIYLLRVTDPVGRSTNYSYERAYEVCVAKGGIENIGECAQTKWAYRLRSVTDPYNRTTTYTYDANTLKVLSATNAAGYITRHTYTPGGLLSTITNPRGFVTTFDWITGPDGTPRIAKVTAADGTATNYAYTHASTAPYRVIKTVVTNARGFNTTYDMNSGDIERVTDPMANVTQYAYDARHNVTRITDPRGHQTTYQYNSRNKVTQIVQAVGTLNLTTTLDWDGNDNLLGVTNPRGIRTEYTYNATHDLIRIRRAVGPPTNR
jgi:YD repeat-containing protein